MYLKRFLLLLSLLYWRSGSSSNNKNIQRNESLLYKMFCFCHKLYLNHDHFFNSIVFFSFSLYNLKRVSAYIMIINVCICKCLEFPSGWISVQLPFCSFLTQGVHRPLLFSFQRTKGTTSTMNIGKWKLQ